MKKLKETYVDYYKYISYKHLNKYNDYSME